MEKENRISCATAGTGIVNVCEGCHKAKWGSTDDLASHWWQSGGET
jgi:hypothetical protein